MPWATWGTPLVNNRQIFSQLGRQKEVVNMAVEKVGEKYRCNVCGNEVEVTEVGGGTLQISSVSMGNPHAVIYVDDIDDAPVGTLGPLVESHRAFPNRVNVEFVELTSRGRVCQRTWERGTGETLACGSGACAVVVVSILRGVVDRSVIVALPGGELSIQWDGDGAGVSMTGPAASVFTGRIEIERR